tara:strand:+ start:235 stop:546 length:312 start_codon:yes stop_codon:yes gene_type:complete
VSLVGHTCNRSGIGCQLIIDTDANQFVRDVFPASGFMGSGPVEQNVGLGSATLIKRLTVRWPDGEFQQFENLEVDHHHEITQDRAALQSTPLKQPDTLTPGED